MRCHLSVVGTSFIKEFIVWIFFKEYVQFFTETTEDVFLVDFRYDSLLIHKNDYLFTFLLYYVKG